jgi:diguanylate cyclase (GGDEF)-like protein
MEPTDKPLEPTRMDATSKRLQALEQLVELSVRIIDDPDLGSLMQRAVRAARRLTGAEAGRLFLRQGSDLSLVVVQNDRLAQGLGERGLKRLFQELRLPVDEPSLVGFVARSGQPLYIPDAYAIPAQAPYRFNPAWDAKISYRTQSVLLIPLMDRGGNNVGVLELLNARDATGAIVDFDPADQRLVLALATHAALAIEHRRLTELSFVDPLTGAYNRRYFLVRLEEEIKRHLRNRQPFALVMFDVDGFKQVNDTWGHVAGDSVLTTISHLLTGQSRGFTVLARLGGDEFGALLIDTFKRGALEYAERIRRVVEAYPFAHGPVTMSGGLVSVPEDGLAGSDLKSERLVDVADQSLYNAKRAGRNRIATL